MTTSSLRFSVVALAVVAAACTKASVAESDAGTDAIAPVPAVEAGASFADGAHDYRGTIGGQAVVAVHLVRAGVAVTGAYLYTKMNRPIALAGSVDGAGAMTLDETVNGEATGTFHIHPAGAELAGDWTDGNATATRGGKGTKTLPVALSPADAVPALLAPIASSEATVAAPSAHGLASPTDAECKSAAAQAHEPGQTQLVMNDQASARATLADCDVRRAYDDLRKSIASSPAAVAELDAAQLAWRAYRDAHDTERYPDEDKGLNYGSIYPSCVEDEDATFARARTAMLRAQNKCKETAATLPQAKAVADQANVALNDADTKVRAAHMKDHVFIAAFERATVAWAKLRSAQLAFVGALTGGVASACAERELAGVTGDRTKTIGAWLKAPEDGDTCAGSY